MNISINKTNRSQFHFTENLTRETFWNLYQPGCSEHLVLHNLRKSNNYIEELDLVAFLQDEIIGHIISTKATIIGNRNFKHEVLCIGPFAVASTMQGKGIGSKLLHTSIKQAGDMGFAGMFLFGNPDYYQRFGFVNAQQYGITTKDGENFDAFMALELYQNSLANIKGRFFEDNAFFVSAEELSRFEKQFPPKEKGDAKIKIAINK